MNLVISFALCLCLLLLSVRTDASTFFDTSFETCAVGTGNDFPCEGWTDANQERVDFLRIVNTISLSGTKAVALYYQGVNGSVIAPSIYYVGFPSTTRMYARFGTYQAAGFQLGANGVTKRVRFRPSGGYPVFSVWNHFNDYTIAVEGPYIGCTVNYKGGGPPTPNAWDQVELEVKLNTPGQSNGEARLWVNNVLRVTVTGKQFIGPTPTSAAACGGQLVPSTNTFYQAQIYLQSGNGTLYYDRFAVGNTRIGIVGNPPPPDTTAPSPPTAPALSASGGSVSFNWINGSDSVAMASAAVERCAGAACTATTVLTTVSASNNTAGTFNDTTVLANTTYGYKVRNIDASGNPSSFTSIIYVTTPNVFRVTLATDNFNRANNTDLGAQWDAGYTPDDPLAIQSNQVRVAAINRDSRETFNGITTPNDQWAQFTYSLVAGSGLRAPRILLRHSNAPTRDGYECGALLTTTTRCVEWNAGVSTQKTSVTTWTWQAGDKLRVEAEGTTIRAYGIRGESETLITSFTDATFTTGKTGIIHYVQTGTTSDVQIDDWLMGGFGTAPTQPPAVSSVILDSTGANVQFDASRPMPTQVRVTFGTNNGLFSQTVIEPISAFTGGRYNRLWIAGLNFACFVAIDGQGVENIVSSEYQCGNLTPHVPLLDRDPAILTNPFPSAILPVGTTEREIGFTVNKTVNCRVDLNNVSYSLMTIPMTVSNLTASVTISGLTNGLDRTYYYRCNFINSLDEEWPNTTSGTIRLQVDTSTTDTTRPADVTNVVATPIPLSSDVSIVFDETGDDVGMDHYQIYLSLDDVTYVLSGSATTSPTIQSGLTRDTPYYFKMKGVDTSGNLSLNFSNVAPVTTSHAPDITPPSQLIFQSITPGVTSVDVVWIGGSDEQGQVTSQIEYCAGALCNAFTFSTPRLTSLETVLDLTPGTFYRMRGRHFDETGNAGPYSEVQEFTTNATTTSEPPETGVCNCRNPHDARH